MARQRSPATKRETIRAAKNRHPSAAVGPTRSEYLCTCDNVLITGTNSRRSP
jgi:hypothetical protein